MEIGENVDAPLAALIGEVEPPPPRFRMHFDADRDGQVDDDWMGLARWELGRGKRGTIFACNNDDDDDRGVPDNRDGKVNGGNDSSELAPIVIRRHGPGTVPGSWQGVLEVSPIMARRVRIFDARSGGREVIGPTMGARYQLPDLGFTEKELGIEALFFAGEDGGWDGLVAITWLIEDGDGLVAEQTGTMRVAPWMMPSHLEPADKVFVVDAGGFNRRFRAELSKAVASAGCSLQQFRQDHDLWMQDCMEIGYTFVPRRHMPVVMRAKRDRALSVFPRTLLKPDFGYEEPAPLSTEESTFDSNGNLEVTPPVKSRDGHNYPWGRIYFGPGRPGERFAPEVMSLLDAQRVQAPIRIDTGWLTVGHVDEIISFVPAPGAKGFKLLLASPKRAFDLLRWAAAAGHGSSKMLIGRDFQGISAEISVNHFLERGIAELSLSASDLRTFNGKVMKRLAAIERMLQLEISLDPDDLIEVPIVFMPNDEIRFLADALTAGMVNMLVINKHCIVPKPFGPVVGGMDLFAEDLRGKLTSLGLEVRFIDDWAEYHVNLGEVHCATNTLRKPDPSKWNWWEIAP
ncbi:MAG TPA: protein-arginine deiminase family protein [Polyangia bacterium]|nr:protein-arginine deiminase family protein [Polyangia bacterium]